MSKNTTETAFIAERVEDLSRFGDYLCAELEAAGLAIVPKAILSDEQIRNAHRISVKAEVDGG